MNTGTRGGTSDWPAGGHGTAGPLRGLRVLDLTAFAVGPWAAMLLAQLGADVVKIEPPRGDGSRLVKPTKRGEPTTYTVCNGGKRSVALDLRAEDGRAVALRLAAGADLLVENSRPGAMDRLGLGYREVAALNPGVVYCSSSSFGDTGPMATVGSTDPQGQAFSGFAALNGEPRGRPELLRYAALVDLTTSMYLLQGALAGLLARQRTGAGRHVRTSQMEAAVAVQATRLAAYLAGGGEPERLGSGSAAVAPSRAFPCADGAYLAVTAHTQGAWEALCRVAGLEDLPADPRFRTNADRLANRATLDDLLAGALRRLPLRRWTQLLLRAGVPSGPFLTLEGAEHHAQVRDNGFVVRVPHPVEGTIATGGPPWRFSRTPATVRPAPRPGAHTGEVIAALSGGGAPAGAGGSGRAGSGGGGTDPGGAGDGPTLAGVTVVEVAEGVAGPYAGWLLAALGARVLKVEPAHGDWLRHTGSASDRHGAEADVLNRGKSSLAVDLAHPEAPDLLRRLVAPADVLLLDRAPTAGGPLAGEDLLTAFPRLVRCTVSALGDQGPWRDRAATELEVQAFAGVTRYLGRPGGPPERVGADIAGILGGCAAAQGVLAALAERHDSGCGQDVAVAQAGAVIAACSIMLGALDEPDVWEGFHCLAATAPRDHGIPTLDGTVLYGQPLRSEEAWRRFCREIGAEELLERQEYATRELRQPRIPELRRDLAPYFARFTTAELLDIVARTEGIAVPLNTYGMLDAHPQVRSMGLFVTAVDGSRVLAPPWRLGDGPRTGPGRVPAVGADTVGVLRELGLGQREVDDLCARGVVVQAPGSP